MLVQVEQKLQKLEHDRNENYYNNKKENLLQWGLARKGKKGEEIPIIVTDEEYEALLSAQRKLKFSEKNKVANILNIFSVLVIALCVVAGATAWILTEQLGFIWFSLFVFAGIIFSVLFKGISEVIILLQDLAAKEKESPKAAKTNGKEGFPASQPTDYANQLTKNSPPVHYAYPGQEYTKKD